MTLGHTPEQTDRDHAWSGSLQLFFQCFLDDFLVGIQDAQMDIQIPLPEDGRKKRQFQENWFDFQLKRC